MQQFPESPVALPDAQCLFDESGFQLRLFKAGGHVEQAGCHILHGDVDVVGALPIG